MFPNDSILELAASYVNQMLPKLPLFLVGLFFGFVLIRFLILLSRFFLKFAHLPRGLKGILMSLIRGGLWSLYAIAILQFLGFQNVIIFFSSSVVVIGIVMAAGGSTLVSDIFAGIFLAQDTDFQVGDEVIAGDPPTQGIVESMDMRRTRVRDSDGHLHIMPNSVIERKEWVIITKKRDLPKAAKPRRIKKLGQNYKIR